MGKNAIIAGIVSSMLSITICAFAFAAPGKQEAKPSSAPTAVGPELIINGSFETCVPVFSGEFQNYPYPSTNITGWMVSRGDLDIHQYPPWKTPDGKQCIDLNGYNAGSLKQSFATEPGATYRVKFIVAGNFMGDGAIKPFFVRAAGQSKSMQFDTTAMGKDNLAWRDATFEFTAKEAKSTLEFGSLMPKGNGGAMIDSVSVRKLNVPLKPVPQSETAKQPPGVASPTGITDLATADDRLGTNLQLAAKKGYIQAGADGKFQPNDPVTRGDFTNWLTRIKQISLTSPEEATYADVPTSDPNFRYIESATQENLMSGYEEDNKTLFKPAQQISRQEFAELYCQFSDKQAAADKLSDEEVVQELRFSPSQSGESTYKDITTFNNAQKRYIAVAHHAGVLSKAFNVDPYAKTDEQKFLLPEKPVTRAEAVNILMSLYGN